ncbi:unnamed protein product [Caenorhabditis angaria]|uniref:Uncharacterized protein n=1 Tax=Caenorhabditis angaria TaxID=860376 RepID=A0A9P1ID52_9PELO|nr:unnamed protein product [Caenorhabditis angaria]
MSLSIVVGSSQSPKTNIFVCCLSNWRAIRHHNQLFLSDFLKFFNFCRCYSNFEDGIPTSASDHRISSMFGISEAEQKVVDIINKIREEENDENAKDYKDVKIEDENKAKKKFELANDADFYTDAGTSNLVLEIKMMYRLRWLHRDLPIFERRQFFSTALQSEYKLMFAKTEKCHF